MSRTRLLALAIAALGLTAAGCDPLVQSAVSRQTAADVSLDQQATRMGDTEKGECTSCAKFRARPPSGINTPPVL